MRAATLRGAVEQLDRGSRPPLLQGLTTTWRHLPQVLLVGVALTAAVLLWVGAAWASTDLPLGPALTAAAGIPVVLVWAVGTDRARRWLEADEPAPDPPTPAHPTTPARRAAPRRVGLPGGPVRALSLGWPVLLAGTTALSVVWSPTPLPSVVLGTGAVGLLLAGWLTAAVFAGPPDLAVGPAWRDATRRAGRGPAAAAGLLVLLGVSAAVAVTWGPWLLPLCLGTLLVLATALTRPAGPDPTRRP